MKKIKTLLSIICIGILLGSCGVKAPQSTDGFDVHPAESIGNQLNQLTNSGFNFIIDGKFVYGAARQHEIVKYPLSDLSNKKTLYTADWTLDTYQVKSMAGWLYFTVSDSVKKGTFILYRIRETGGDAEKILDGLKSNYFLTEEGIYYGARGRIHIMSFDGKNKREIALENSIKGGHYLIGADNGWIYYFDGKNNVFRVRPNSTKPMNVLSAKDGFLVGIDKNRIYYCNYDRQAKDFVFAVKPIDGKEKILFRGSKTPLICTNIDGDELYYSEGSRVYEIKKDGTGPKRLVCKLGEDDYVGSINLYDGTLIISGMDQTILITKNGTVTKMQ